MRILDRYYKWVGDSDIIKYILKRNIEINWVIEAGCHDGQDTLLINKLLQPARIIAFEPDNQARLKARSAFAEANLVIELYDFGLSDKNSTLFMNFLGGHEGTGSTFLAETGSSPVDVKRLDDLELNLVRDGMLWLDVEGHAINVLRGAEKTLKKLVAAKIEIQMHAMNESRLADYREVNALMGSHGLIPVRAPIHPGFFGDVIYVRRNMLLPIARMWSFFLILQMHFLHGYIYPRLRKPSPN